MDVHLTKVVITIRTSQNSFALTDTRVAGIPCTAQKPQLPSSPKINFWGCVHAAHTKQMEAFQGKADAIVGLTSPVISTNS